MLEKAKQKMMGKAMQKAEPSEKEAVQALAEVIAGLEHEQAQAIAALVDAAGLDLDVHHDQQVREQQLLDTADAVAQQRLPEYALGQLDVEGTEKAMQHLGSDEWPEQKREWYKMYRERGVVDGPPVDDATDEDVDRAAKLHVPEVFGLSLAEFEQYVVNWDRGAAVEELLAGPLVGHTQTIKHVAAEIDTESDES